MNVPDQGVDLDGLDVVKLLQGLLDLALVGLGVHNEDKRVVLLDLLHRALGVQWVNNHLVVVETGLMRDRLAGIFGRSGELEGLWSVERCRCADLVDLVRVHLDGSSALRSYHSSWLVVSVCLTPFNTALAAAPALALGLEAIRRKISRQFSHSSSSRPDASSPPYHPYSSTKLASR